MLESLPFWRNNSICRFQPTKPVAGITSTSQANLPLPPSAPLRLCASARVLPIPISISILIATMIWLIGHPPYSYSYSPHHRVRERVPLRWVRVRFWAELEAVRKGSRFPNLPSSSPSGKPPAEGAVTFSTNRSGWVGSMLYSLLFRGILQLFRFSRPRQLLNTTPM